MENNGFSPIRSGRRKNREIDDGGRSRIILSDKQKGIVERLISASGLGGRFSIADRNLDTEQLKPVGRTIMFDRFFDAESGHCLPFRRGLIELDAALGDKASSVLSEEEMVVYGTLLEEFGVESKNMVEDESGKIFRNRGLRRRFFRWCCMDELATALHSKEAAELWETEGHPRAKRGYGDKSEHVETMEEFRKDCDKYSLTEKEFDRISEVFRKCINMAN